MISPVTSTRVATNGADEVAGSNPSRRRTKGSTEPTNDSPQDDADERKRDRHRDQQPVRTIDIRERRPDRDARKADGAEYGAERES